MLAVRYSKTMVIKIPFRACPPWRRFGAMYSSLGQILKDLKLLESIGLKYQFTAQPELLDFL